MARPLAKVLDMPADRIAKGLHGYYPEMGDRKPNCQMEVRYAWAGKWTVKTPPHIQLKGRGITFEQTYRPQDLTHQAQHKVGWHVYTVTRKAIDKIKEEYSVSMEILLD